jgi:hypothetical protein
MMSDNETPPRDYSRDGADYSEVAGRDDKNSTGLAEHLAPVSEALELALDYARRGWHVFPCWPDDKKPVTTNGLYDASTNKTKIQRWWRRYPLAMIGVVCGEKSGVWCLDLDAPNDKNPIDGLIKWQELKAEHGKVLATHTHITPGGGKHLIFKWRPDRPPITNRAGNLKGKHIDVRGQGGYFIACGSVNSADGKYQMAEALDYFSFAPAPDWLHDIIEAKAEQPGLLPSANAYLEYGRFVDVHFPKHQGELSEPGSTRYALKALHNESNDLAATRANRNDRLNIAAISLGRFVKSSELSESQVIDALVKACDANGLNKDDGLRQTHATIKSGLGAATPRVMLEPVAKPQETSPGKGFPFKSAKEFRSTINKDWIVKGVIAPDEISNWCGPPKSGKSALVGDLAVHVCAGIDWRGYRSKQSGAVVYFAWERADLVERRWITQCALYGLSAEEQPFFVVRMTEGMMNPTCVADFVATIRNIEALCGLSVRMAVFDTSAKAIAAGSGDENIAKDKGIMRANLRRIMAEVEGLHIALISHTGKDIEKGERGSNAGLGDDDVFIQLDGSLAQVKARNNGPTGLLTAYAVKGIELGVDEDGDVVDIGVIAPHGSGASSAAGQRDRLKLTDQQRLALIALERAITDDGKPMPVGSDYPKGVTTCTDLDQWRKVFQSLSDSGKADSVRKAFDRAHVFLKVNGWIGVWRDRVWLAYN